MASGEKKYGLIDPKKKMSVADVFNNDSDSGDEREMMRKRLQQGAEKGAKKQTIIDINRALEQDPTVYQYDEVYETMKKPEQEASKATVVRKPKYMDALLKTADKRKKENERRTERLVQKEREAEGDEFKDKEEFITSSYRQKLEEMKKAEEEEKKMEYIESIMDVTKQQDLGSFYRQLYKETVPDSESKEPGKTNEVVNDEPKKAEPIEKTASSSSSSGSDSSSDSSSSSSDSSSEDEKSKESPKPDQSEKNVASPEKPETPSAETTAAPEVEASAKTAENDAKFNNTKKRDRTYRRRESSPKKAEPEKEPAKVHNSSSHRKPDENRSRRDDRGREYGRAQERDRERDRGRSRRDEPRSSYNTDRYRNDRNDSRRQRSRSRSKRDKDGSRNSYNTDRRRPRETPNDEKRERSGKAPGEPVEKRSKEEANNKSDKKENVKPEVVSSNGNVESSEKEVKIDIWKKRTVGAVFDAALERYFQRKAARGS